VGVESPVRRRPSARVVLECMRPYQWTKNAFVLAGVVFAGKALDPGAVIAALVVTGAFCLAGGAAYLLNDAHDAELDRLSPRTAGRPVARGDLSPRRAVAAAGGAAIAALALAELVNPGSVAVVAAYLVLQVAYSTGLKLVAFLDVLAIAAGFVLRAAAGGVAIAVPVTPWLLVSTGLLALFLGLAKRRGELFAGGLGRPGLARYSLPALDRALDTVAAVTVAVYVAYVFAGAPSPWMAITVPFVVFGLLRVRAALRRDPLATEDPAEMVLRDRVLGTCVALWAISAAAIAVVAAT
jgi:4-hydroxybenzoate polyprenyltransferase